MGNDIVSAGGHLYLTLLREFVPAEEVEVTGFGGDFDHFASFADGCCVVVFNKEKFFGFGGV